MKNYFLLFLAAILTFSGKHLAQEKPRGVELPEFVITGVQKINIPQMDKLKPDFLPTLGKDFFSPPISPEDFKLAEISNPINLNADLYEKKDPVNFLLRAEGGKETMPGGLIRASGALAGILFDGGFEYSRIRDYKVNAGSRDYLGKLALNYFTGNNSGFFSKNTLSVEASLGSGEYYLFGSDFYDTKREYDSRRLKLSYNNSNYSFLSFGGDADFSSVELEETQITSSTYGMQEMNAHGGFDLIFPDVKFSGNANFSRYINRIDFLNSGSSDLISLSGVLKLMPSVGFQIGGGANYYQSATKSSIYPYALISLKMGNSITILGEYTPGFTRLSPVSFQTKNPYTDLLQLTGNIEERTLDIKGALKFEYDKYFEINAGVRYAKSDNRAYFEDINADGIFNIAAISGVSTFELNTNFLFYNGPSGEFYANAAYLETRSGDFYLPYIPQISGEAYYRFNMLSFLRLEPGIEIKLKSYESIVNDSELPAYYDLKLNICVEIYESFLIDFRFSNILNRENFIFRNYPGKPSDLNVRAEFRF